MILVGAELLVAAINRRDPAYQACRKVLDSRTDGLLVTPYVTDSSLVRPRHVAHFTLLP